MTHQESEPCPFKKDDNPVGMLATCCSYRGNAVALYLLVMGLFPLVFRLYENKTPEQAASFAEDLHGAVKMYQEKMRGISKKAGVTSADPLEGLTVRVPDIDWSFSVDKAFGSLEAAALWHEKIAQMGFGVYAWF